MHQVQSCTQQRTALCAALAAPCIILSAPGLLRLSLEPLKAAVQFVVLRVSPRAPHKCPTTAACSLRSLQAQVPPQVPQNCLAAAVCAPADAYNGLWDSSSELPDPVSSYYLSAMDAMYPLCPSCLFLVQGTGERLRLCRPVPQPWRSCLLRCPLLVMCIQRPLS